MSTRKAKRQPKAHAVNVKAMHFCELERDLPIAGTPAPKPCPFCGVTDVSIEFTNGEYPSAYVQCDHCGVEGAHAGEDEGREGSYALALEAARLWNERKGGVA
jgi:hypothetical protein